MSGYPAIAHRQWLKAMGCIPRLPDMRRSITELEKKIAELEKELQKRGAS
jgi:UDP-3-O-[3-hydroxymyristoyl] glucosamine N-acyltransferase